MSFVTSLYEKHLMQQVNKYPLPEHISLVISETDLLHADGFRKLKDFVLWCKQTGIEMVSIYIDVLDTEETLKSQMTEKLTEKISEFLRKTPQGVGYRIFAENGKVHSERKGKDFQAYVSIGFGGRKEVTNAVRDILQKVKEGKIKPSDISEKDIESRLKVKHEPDLFIRSGGKHLSDFLIWQSIYSEYYFTDVDWQSIRKLDIIRIIRDFQKRQRRFGK
ncbi:undecaprenyl diphosphate synthase family protein [Methanolobus bombayensis]|uniref:undecaprenyl diphosphate synthase family protein n=1 Tax=Methanolobus bombayensis TaxID=38023 RepID=UPI001AE3F21D|nr:undecaprenyl diphosphate synthase family protein [Methanolobus bombayensis]MBP1907855.1 undecaprenyl diphosphate synthase [Methanolobus bombayensis]